MSNILRKDGRGRIFIYRCYHPSVIIQPCEMASEELAVQQEVDFSTEYIPQSTAPLSGSKHIRNHGDSPKFQSEDFGNERSQPHCPIEFFDNEEMDLDSMWNDVCETLIAESSEREFVIGGRQRKKAVISLKRLLKK